MLKEAITVLFGLIIIGFAFYFQYLILEYTYGFFNTIYPISVTFFVIWMIVRLIGGAIHSRKLDRIDENVKLLMKRNFL